MYIIALFTRHATKKISEDSLNLAPIYLSLQWITALLTRYATNSHHFLTSDSKLLQTILLLAGRYATSLYHLQIKTLSLFTPNCFQPVDTQRIYTTSKLRLLAYSNHAAFGPSTCNNLWFSWMKSSNHLSLQWSQPYSLDTQWVHTTSKLRL